MSRHDDLEYDIRNLAVLVETVTEMAIDFPNEDIGSLRDHVNKIGSLLWIARGLTAELCLDAADAHLVRVKRGSRL